MCAAIYFRKKNLITVQDRIKMGTLNTYDSFTLEKTCKHATSIVALHN